MLLQGKVPIQEMLVAIIQIDRIEFASIDNCRLVKKDTISFVSQSMASIIDCIVAQSAKRNQKEQKVRAIVVDDYWLFKYPDLYCTLKNQFFIHLHTEVEVYKYSTSMVAAIKQQRLNGSNQGIIGLTLSSKLWLGIEQSLFFQNEGTPRDIGLLSYRDSTFEKYCGVNAFDFQYGIPFRKLIAEAHKQDKLPLALFGHYGKDLGNLLKVILHIYDPQVIALHGPLVQAYPYFKKAMWESLNTFQYPHIIKNLLVLPYTKEDSVLWGAASLAQETLVMQA
jgi:hypothetical protein